jgi:hypothetical protein
MHSSLFRIRAGAGSFGFFIIFRQDDNFAGGGGKTKGCRLSSLAALTETNIEQNLALVRKKIAQHNV